MQRAEDAELSLDSPGLAEHLLHDLAVGKDVVLLVSPFRGGEVLDHAAVALEGRRDRVIRVSGAGEEGLGLPGLLQQLGRYAEHLPGDPTDAQERHIAALTTAGPSCDRIVLLVDNADLFESGALRAIELACQTSGQNGGLCLVFAGLPRMLALLKLEETPVLRGRLLRGVRYTETVETLSPFQGRTATLEALAPRSRRISAQMIGFACAALLGLFGVITVRAFVPRKIEQPPMTTGAPATARNPMVDSAPAAEVSAESRPGGDNELAPAPSLFVPAPAPAADAGPTTKVRAAKPPPEHAGRAMRPLTHAAPASRNVVEKESPDDYIGSFSPGADGVRSFKYRP